MELQDPSRWKLVVNVIVLRCLTARNETVRVRLQMSARTMPVAESANVIGEVAGRSFRGLHSSLPAAEERSRTEQRVPSLAEDYQERYRLFRAERDVPTGRCHFRLGSTAGRYVFIEA